MDAAGGSGLGRSTNRPTIEPSDRPVRNGRSTLLLTVRTEDKEEERERESEGARGGGGGGEDTEARRTTRRNRAGRRKRGCQHHRHRDPPMVDDSPCRRAGVNRAQGGQSYREIGVCDNTRASEFEVWVHLECCRAGGALKRLPLYQ